MSVADELFAKGAVVVNLAVENHTGACLLVPHRLAAAGEVDNAEPPHRKPETVFRPDSLVVRSAMLDRSIHLSQYLNALLTRKRTRDTNNSTHLSLISSALSFEFKRRSPVCR